MDFDREPTIYKCPKGRNRVKIKGKLLTVKVSASLAHAPPFVFASRPLGPRV